jgi:DNA topoisomerase VI subunit B
MDSMRSVVMIRFDSPELITSITEFADAVKVLSSDLSQQLSSSLSVMADVERESGELLEIQSKQDLESISGTGVLGSLLPLSSVGSRIRSLVEEYLRMIASVRVSIRIRKLLHLF